MARTKKEIGKETMYNKIMPTTKAGRTSSEPEESVGAAGLQAPSSIADAEASMPESSFFQRSAGVGMDGKKPPVLVNLMERLVAERMESAITRFNCCKCDRCKLDIAAIALNKLPPQYVVVEKNMLMELLAKQASLDVTTAVIQAILQVRDNPRH